MGFKCVSAQAAPASLPEIWRAEQCSQVIEQMPAIQATSPLKVKDALLNYCGQTNGSSQLAARSGVGKSVLSRWLSKSKACISLSMLLDIAASEGFSLAGMLRGDLSRTPVPAGVCPSRQPRTLPRIDHRKVEMSLQEALVGDGTISQVADSLGVSEGSLARHKRLYGELRDRNMERSREERDRVQKQAIAAAEQVAVVLLRSGRTPSIRRATEVTGEPWRPSELRTVALMQLRRQLGDNRIRLPVKASNIGLTFTVRIGQAARRVEAAVAAPQQALVV